MYQRPRIDFQGLVCPGLNAQSPIMLDNRSVLKNGTLKAYKHFPHGMPTTQADTINSDLLAFLKH